MSIREAVTSPEHVAVEQGGGRWMDGEEAEACTPPGSTGSVRLISLHHPDFYLGVPRRHRLVAAQAYPVVWLTPEPRRILQDARYPHR